jgi:hypothetical protein
LRERVRVRGRGKDEGGRMKDEPEVRRVLFILPPSTFILVPSLTPALSRKGRGSKAFLLP